MERVAEEIKSRGEQTGISDESDKYERYGLYFPEPIGYILKYDGSRIPLGASHFRTGEAFGYSICRLIS